MRALLKPTKSHLIPTEAVIRWTLAVRVLAGTDSVILNNYVGPTSDIQQIGQDQQIEVSGKDRTYQFTVKVYKIYYSAITNKICLTANKREVTEASLHTFVPEFKETMSEITEKGVQKNFMVKAYVLGEYLDENVTIAPDGEGYFGYLKDFNAYVEIKSYKKVIADAKMRNQIFFHKLGLV